MLIAERPIFLLSNLQQTIQIIIFYKRTNARQNRRAYFFAFFSKLPSPNALSQWEQVKGCFWDKQFFIEIFIFFLKNRLRFGIPIPNKWRDKNFLRFRGCIWLFSVGISEGTFWSSRIKFLNRKKYFSIFLWKQGAF